MNEGGLVMRGLIGVRGGRERKPCPKRRQPTPAFPLCARKRGQKEVCKWRGRIGGGKENGRKEQREKVEADCEDKRKGRS